MDDIQLEKSDLQSLSDADSIRSFFLTLGYDIAPLDQTPEALGITNEKLTRNIEENGIKQIAVQFRKDLECSPISARAPCQFYQHRDNTLA